MTSPRTTVRSPAGAWSSPAARATSRVPALHRLVPESVRQFTPFDYRSPEQLPHGRTLVVGASATGVQLAAEIQRSGRPTTSPWESMSVCHGYRGRDVLWWMDASGVWNQRYDAIDDLTRARRLPSPQLVGTPERTTLDLNALAGLGVELVGRLSMVRDGRALFSGGLEESLCTRRFEDGAAARRSTNGRAQPGRTRSPSPNASSRPACRQFHRCRSISAAAK